MTNTSLNLKISSNFSKENQGESWELMIVCNKKGGYIQILIVTKYKVWTYNTKCMKIHNVYEFLFNFLSNRSIELQTSNTLKLASKQKQPNAKKKTLIKIGHSVFTSAHDVQSSLNLSFFVIHPSPIRVASFHPSTQNFWHSTSHMSKIGELVNRIVLDSLFRLSWFHLTSIWPTLYIFPISNITLVNLTRLYIWQYCHWHISFSFKLYDIAQPTILKFPTNLGLFPKCVFPKYQPIDPKFAKPHVDVSFQLTWCPLMIFIIFTNFHLFYPWMFSYQCLPSWL